VDDGLRLASWRFAAETGTHVLRLVCSGLFDEFPRLQMIIGHLGEMLPFAGGDNAIRLFGDRIPATIGS
jgi:2,3-dihydroxybenzoate decarboxylase